MQNPITDDSPSPDGPAHRHWQLLFQDTVLAVPGPEAQPRRSLSQALKPLRLSPEQFERIAASVDEALAQASRSAAVPLDRPSFLLQVYVPQGAETRSGSSQNWGFFWIKKSGEGPDRGDSLDSRIEVYLYLDG